MSRINETGPFQAAPVPWKSASAGRFKEGKIALSSLKVSGEGPVKTVTLDRPAEGNCIDFEMASELRELCAQLSADEFLRVVIFTGGGELFSNSSRTLAGPGEVPLLQVAHAVAALPVPVLVALNGDATDHGLELALAGDLRLAAPGASFGFSTPSAGTFPFDGGTQRLPRLVGPAWARDMLLTGRRVDAAEALAIGLVNRVASSREDLMGMTLELAGQIAEGSPLGARYVKEAVFQGADLPLSQALGLEADLNVILQSTNDRAEGIASFLLKRAPAFRGE